MDNQEYVSVKASQYKVMMVIAARYFSEVNDKLRFSILHHPSNQIPKNIFFGLEWGFQGHFQAASIIQVLLDQKNVCIGWNSWNNCDDQTFTRKQIIKQAQNVNNLSWCVWKFNTSESRVRGMYMDVCLRLIEECQQILRNVKPQLIMRGWLKRLSTSSNERHKKKYMETVLNYCQWAGQFDKKYGEVIATQIISEEIATGKVFQGKKPSMCKEEDVVGYLLAAGKQFIQRDKMIQQEEEVFQQQEKSLQQLP